VNDAYQLLLGVAIVRSLPTLYALYQRREINVPGPWGPMWFGQPPQRTTRRQSRKRKGR
jgi:hypothetical protein